MSETAKAYCVAEIGWEYNDEYYYRPDSDGVTPRTVFRFKEDAEAEAKRLNDIERAKEHDMCLDCVCDDDGNYPVVTEFYEIVEVELAL